MLSGILAPMRSYCPRMMRRKGFDSDARGGVSAQIFAHFSTARDKCLLRLLFIVDFENYKAKSPKSCIFLLLIVDFNLLDERLVFAPAASVLETNFYCKGTPMKKFTFFERENCIIQSFDKNLFYYCVLACLILYLQRKILHTLPHYITLTYNQ